MIEAFIERIPKAELYVHLEGTLEPELLLVLAKRNQVTLPYTTVEEVRQAYQFQSSAQFHSTYQACLKVIANENDFYDLASSYFQKAHAQNIRHTELTVAIQAHLAHGIPFADVIIGIQRAMVEAEKAHGISAQIILGFSADIDLELAQSILLQAQEYKHWIVAINVDTTDTSTPPGKFAELFARAREYGFSTVATTDIHNPVDYIWQIMDTLKVSRIANALNCIEDSDLVSRLALTAMPLMIAPLADIRLGAIKSFKDYPFKKMRQEGLYMTLNSAYPAFAAANLSQNLLSAHALLKFNKAEVLELVTNAFAASFMDHDKKEKCLAELDKFYKQALQI